jgi:hypothetical protein
VFGQLQSSRYQPSFPVHPGPCHDPGSQECAYQSTYYPVNSPSGTPLSSFSVSCQSATSHPNRGTRGKVLIAATATAAGRWPRNRQNRLVESPVLWYPPGVHVLLSLQLSLRQSVRPAGLLPASIALCYNDSDPTVSTPLSSADTAQGQEFFGFSPTRL